MDQVTQFYSALILFAVFAGILFFVILVLRELACWYFKINDRLELEKEMLAQLKIISARLILPAVADKPAVKAVKRPLVKVLSKGNR